MCSEGNPWGGPDVVVCRFAAPWGHLVAVSGAPLRPSCCSEVAVRGPAGAKRLTRCSGKTSRELAERLRLERRPFKRPRRPN